jgi:hypothetical protein
VDQEPAQLGSEPVGTGDPHGRRLRRRRNACCRRGGPISMGDREGSRVTGRSPWLRRAPQRLSGSAAGSIRRSTYDRKVARSQGRKVARSQGRLLPLVAWGPVCTWSRLARLSAPPSRSNRTMTCRSALTTDAAWERRGLRCSARSLAGFSWPPALPRTRPLPRRRTRPGLCRRWRRRVRPALAGRSLASSRSAAIRARGSRPRAGPAPGRPSRSIPGWCPWGRG